MTIKTLFLVNTIIATVFGVVFLLIPETTAAMYGITLNDGAAVIARLFGASVLGFGILTLLTREAPQSDARSAIVTALFIADVIGCVVSIYAQVAGVVNALGLTTIAIYGLLAVGFGVFAFGKKAE